MNDPALAGSYKELTLLDPHPANPQAPLSTTTALGWLASLANSYFSRTTNDPNIAIPSNVNEVQIFYQTTVASDLSGFEYMMNLQGVSMVSNNPTANETYNLTPFGDIGHSEVPYWYLTYVAPYLNNPAQWQMPSYPSGPSNPPSSPSLDDQLGDLLYPQGEASDDVSAVDAIGNDLMTANSAYSQSDTADTIRDLGGVGNLEQSLPATNLSTDDEAGLNWFFQEALDDLDAGSSGSQVVPAGSTGTTSPAQAQNAANGSSIAASLNLSTPSDSVAAVQVIMYNSDPTDSTNSAGDVNFIADGSDPTATPAAFFDTQVTGVAPGSGASLVANYTVVVPDNAVNDVVLLYYNGQNWATINAPQSQSVTLNSPTPGMATVDITATYSDTSTPAISALTGTVFAPATVKASTTASLSVPTITYGTASTTISGTLDANAGGQNVPAGATVAVTLTGVTQNATLDSSDNFSTTFDTSTLGVSGSPYTIGFSYAGDANFIGTTDSSTLTVQQAAPSVSAPAQSATYTGSPQGFPTSAVTVTGANGLTSSGGTLSFTYNGSSNVPTTAGNYSVVVTFIPNDGTDYTTSNTTTTWTIKQAPPVITWNTPGAIAYFTPLGSNQLNAVANVPGMFVYTPPAGTLLEAGTQTLSAKFTPADSTDYTTATATVQIVVLGPGVKVIGTQLYFVGGSTSNDQVQVNPIGSSKTGSTGIKVNANLNGVNTQTTYSQSFTTINIFLQGGNDNVQLSNGLTINAVVSAGDGNDNLQLGDGNYTVTVGNGNDNVQAGSGTSVVSLGNGNDNFQAGAGPYIVTLGDGNDNVHLGDGNNTVTVGNGNDNVQVGNGNNVVVTGNGNDNFQAGNGDNLIAAGLGKHNVQVGNGSNILIDGSVALTNSSDSLRQVLNDWMTFGAADAARIRSRLAVTYNSSHANHLQTGSGLDWFWETYAKDSTNRKATDLLN